MECEDAEVRILITDPMLPTGACPRHDLKCSSGISMELGMAPWAAMCLWLGLHLQGATHHMTSRGTV